MLHEPAAREPRDLLERPRLVEQVRGAFDDVQLRLARELRERVPRQLCSAGSRSRTPARSSCSPMYR